ncbi:MAG: hypothetical protein L0H19_00825 [Salinisphaera sp.]|nr:hypothetical protein [Salinisphaera sp.]MDN5939774.1 hypothetical protein [Salinisphaera sp.]
MNTISMLELRRDAERIVRRVQLGETLLLTYRRRPVLRLEPLEETSPATAADDPLRALIGLAGAASGLKNEAIDALVYGD